MKKTYPVSGADERTPSKSQYFSWINNTNEGSTEQNSLINLDFFKYLFDEYNMRLDIYAWDAGNLDGAGNGYETLDGEKLSKQYPSGYAPVVKAADKLGIRMGVWGGADGYGDTAEDAEKRRKLLVKLCKDYHFVLFKFDAVCGELRPEKRGEFAATMRECRKYCPDLIVLNHRNDLGEEQKYATTFLWEGMETYVDVHGYNQVTAPHNRAYTFFRGHTPKLKRLAEDHGVCISSSVGYFEDDLVYQAFNRSLILAPEIYGNPWFMRDDELPRLARIFNLHRRYRNVLVDGMLPDASLGDLGNNAVLRGDGKQRFLATGNASWTAKEITIPLNERIGLEKTKKVCVHRYFPTEIFVGEFNYDDTVKLIIPPFRAALYRICDSALCEDVIIGGEYRVIKEDEDGRLKQIELLYAEKPTLSTYRGTFSVSLNDFAKDVRQLDPVKLGSLSPCPVPENAEQLYETACFFTDNDALEKRSLLRAGKTNIPQVQAARDAFFKQDSYILRGCDCDSPFSGNEDAVFDVKSRAYYNFDDRKGFRIDGGCLRVDLGDTVNADRIEIEYFDAHHSPEYMFDKQEPTSSGETSPDLSAWTIAPLCAVVDCKKAENEYFAYYVDKLCTATGNRMKAVYSVNDTKPFRYFRLPRPVDRIYSIKAFRGDKEIKPRRPHLTNLFAPYDNKRPLHAAYADFNLNDLPQSPYLAVAFEGKTGYENAYCCAKIDGKLYAFPTRAPAYPANAYEYPVHPVDGYYTFYLPVDRSWAGKTISVYALFAGDIVPVDVYLCDENDDRNGLSIDL
ncbi:MAG: hypothetical protein J5762_03385 [Clostridia bacterium]|nr:hypothetical protein [Clostridia bacterium]